MAEFSSDLGDVSSPSVCGIFRSGLSSSQMNSLCYIAECRPIPIAVSETPILRMPHTDDSKMVRQAEENSAIDHGIKPGQQSSTKCRPLKSK